MKKFHRWLLALAVSIASLPVFAAGADWGTHDAAEYAFGAVPPGPSFGDAYTFSLASESDLSASAVANNLLPAFGLTSGLVQLFKVEAGPDQLVGAFAFDGTTGSTPYTFSSLASGDYFYLVSGFVSGVHGALYSLASTVTPVPEPGMSLLFVAGLLGLGVIARRRMTDQS